MHSIGSLVIAGLRPGNPGLLDARINPDAVRGRVVAVEPTASARPSSPGRPHSARLTED
jgi:hypothetical protein